MAKEKKTTNTEKKPITNTWFWKYVVDNKFVSVLFISFLLFLTIFIFINISHIFAPLGQVFSIIGPPIVFGLLFYYLLKPLVDFFRR